jgi:fatty acid-binding protein DegV
MIIFFTVDTLEYPRMSGRVGRLQAPLASLIKIKPIIKAALPDCGLLRYYDPQDLKHLHRCRKEAPKT